jgi:hypothetical protein
MSSISAGTTTGTALVSTGDTTGELVLKTNGSTTAVTIDTAQRVAFVAGTAALPAITTTGDTNTGIFFPAADTIAFAEGGAEVARFDSSGNLGVGISAPTARLHVQSATTGSVIVGKWTDGATDTGYLTTVSGGGVGVGAGGFLTLGAGGGASFTERMRIDSNGQVIVKPSSGGSYTNGDSGFYSDGGFGNNLIMGNTYGAGKGYINFYNGGTGIGSINAATASTVSYVTSSDYRLKEDIAPMTGALDTVSQLKPVTYKWKLDGTNGQGFIAHELQAVVPDCVVGEKDAVETYTDEDGNEQTRIKPQGIDTSFLVATLTAAIQEQQAIITDLKSRIEALENT